MKYLLYKMIIAEDPSAELFKEFSQLWIPITYIEKNYEGPLHYWDFYQLGDFDQLDVSIIKCELWSAWRINVESNELNKSAFIGVNSMLGFYNSKDQKSFKNMQEIIELLYEKVRKVIPIIVYVLDQKDITNIPPDQLEYFMGRQVQLFPVSKAILIQKKSAIIKKLFSSFVKIYEPQLVADLDIIKNWWKLSLDELVNILEADRNGVALRPRRPKPLPKIALEEETDLEDTFKKIEEKPVKKEGYEHRKLTLEDLSEEERKFVAIGPNGEIILKEELMKKDKDEIVELIKEGFQLPDWVVIPRHCPQCFNQNQRSIREVDNPKVILMERPRIYAKKYICGQCGKEWSKND